MDRYAVLVEHARQTMGRFGVAFAKVAGCEPDPVRQPPLMHIGLPKGLRDLRPGGELVVQVFQQMRQTAASEVRERTEKNDVLVEYPECAESMFLRGDGIGCHGFAGFEEDGVAGEAIMPRRGKE
ncbi:hypothetical protein OCUBac02_14140 [Bosea sp. ANAM02]|nr:hypothetical protein OCUBac02_14140 [Bosea sp. ANAM02]